MQKIPSFKCNNKNTIKIIILNEQNILLKKRLSKKNLSKIFWAKCHCHPSFIMKIFSKVPFIITIEQKHP